MAPRIQIVKRSEGRSSVAIAAYRAACLLYDERTGERFDYSRKSGVGHSEIIAPEHAPSWATDRQQLWANVELAGKRKDAQVAREFMLPLPHELSELDRLALVRDFVRENLVSQGMIADIAIHLPESRGDQRNHHAHITCTMRHITKDGFGKQAREWNDDFAGIKKLYALQKSGKLEQAKLFEEKLKSNRPIYDWREKWAGKINKHLEKHGFKHRVDHRSWEEQGINREAELHVGVEATNMERKGEKTLAGDERRNVQKRNGEFEQNEQRERELSKKQQQAIHKQAGSLDRTRQALLQLQKFDEGHTKINHLNRQISQTFSQKRSYENRRTYADRLLKQVDRNFEIVFGKKGKAASQKYWKDVGKMGIKKTNAKLMDHTNRYGKLPGWQIGQRLFFSKERYEAKQLLLRTCEIARQGFYMDCKLNKKEALDHKQIEKRLTSLKKQQAQLMKTPPEGRLIIQRALYETAKNLDSKSWKQLTAKDKFHITQARQLMKHKDLRQWADEKAFKLASNDLDLTPSPDFQLSLLSLPVDLKDVSPSYEKAELDKYFDRMKIRHKQDIETLAAAQKAAEEGLSVKRSGLTQKGFVGLLARTTGIDHIIDKVIDKQHRELQNQHAAAKQAMESNQSREIETLRSRYKIVQKRIAQKLVELKGKNLEADKGKSQTRKPKRGKSRDANKRDMGRGRSYGDDRSYGYRRSTKKPKKPDDDD